AFLIRHLARHCGRRAGLLGTIEYDTLSRAVPAPLTTPESVDFAAYLAEAAAAGAEILAAEVSSHALALGRVAGCDFAAAVFTNLTRDHLDYHGTLANYAAAKHKLFLALAPGAPAAANLDDPQAGAMLAGCPGRPETYGIDNPAAVWNAVGLASGIDGSDFTLRHGGPDGTGDHPVHLPVPGRHNVHNALAALAALAPLGLPLDGLIDGLANFKNVPGRLETIRHAGRTACIDYAHTPDALEKALVALRPLTPGKLWAVFGCGGDRDRGKRPQMAAVAERLADKVVVTSDNPRTEEPGQILEDIRAGFADMDMPDFIPDRAAAIAHALRAAATGDTVLIAGKGHEDYQIIGTVKHHFSDRECVEETWK
ncbi:MAG: UDP-N-acetylmuramoyl-L-alanyl-D-glutamate--2,6-diaminopimelate ligase, partial [Planctomycetes bacterium]|nr:UDP-N-acetylmuramoyl-L-alanyl-D-glutamate--2,6-diaminopimelate ligase [Planctomycetota bacterium]